MCGLVGVAGFINKDIRGVFTDLLIADAVRGPHSTGVASIDKDGIGTVFKRPVLPYDFLDMKKADKIISDPTIALIGHNRWATRGRINTNNAHPFIQGSIVGAHNGTLKNQSLLPDSGQFTVDSENIIYSIDKQGMKETYKNLYGSAALTYWDAKEQRLTLLRNEERPLSYCFSKDNKTLFWASESLMLQWVLKRNGILHHDVNDVTPHTQHVFKVPNEIFYLVDKAKPFAKGDVIIRKLEEYTPPVVTYPVQSRTPIVPFQKRQQQISPTRPNLNGIHIGDKVEFLLLSSPTQKKGKWISCGVCDNGNKDDTYVAITIPKKMDLLVSTLSGGEGMMFKGTVSGYHTKTQNGYKGAIYIEPSTVVPSPAEVETHSNFRGYKTTEEQWRKNTRGRCAWCDDLVEFNSNPHYIDDNAVLCDPCYLDPVVEYQLAGSGIFH